MTPTPLHDVWEVPGGAIVPAGWFHDLGVPVFPIADGTKEPATNGASWKGYRSTRAQATSWRAYGVPLGHASGLAVVDGDSAAVAAWVAAHLPPTPFTVTTGPYHDGSPGRGLHRYYRAANPLPSYIHRDGLTIENRNEGLYVLGPGSHHPSGVIYTASWSWNIDDVPFFPADFLFDDGSGPQASAEGTGGTFVLPEAIVEPYRRKTMHALMRALVAHGMALHGATEVCYAVNRTRCHPPLDVETTKLGEFLRRAYKQKDRVDFVRAPKIGWALAGSLLEIGLSAEVVIAAVRSVTPDFDPETSE